MYKTQLGIISVDLLSFSGYFEMTLYSLMVNAKEIYLLLCSIALRTPLLSSSNYIRYV